MEILYGKEQIYVVLAFFAAGIILGAVYDVFVIKRMFSSSHKIILFFDDIIFMGIFTLLFIFTSFAFNNGNIKWYEFPVILFGFVLYKKTVSLYVIKFFIFIKRIITKAFCFIISPFLKIKAKVLEYMQVLYLHLYTYIKRKKMLKIKDVIKGV